MEQKIAIISDIHGNYAALNAALNQIEQDQQIGQIYCLGDLVGIGYETNEVLERLSNQANISFVLGNHDEAILDILAGRVPYSQGKEREHHQWLAARLDRKFIPFLLELPTTLTTVINGKKFLFTHYHLNNQTEFISVDLEPTVEKLDNHYKASNMDVVCFGHHHVIHHFKSRNRLYLNPSSLGCNHQPFAPYTVVEIGNNGEINVHFYEVKYDNRAFLLGYNRLNVPDSDYILKIFHGNQQLQFR